MESIFSKFRDIDLSFKPSALNGDFIALNSENSIKQAVKSLVLTNFNERPFQPFLGSQVVGTLFQSHGDDNFFLTQAVRDVIRFYEPRVNVNSVSVRTDESQSNTLRVSVTFTITQKETEVSFDFFLERTR